MSKRYLWVGLAVAGLSVGLLAPAGFADLVVDGVNGGSSSELGVPAYSSFDPFDNGEPVQVRTLSGRADLVTGGDTFVEIALPDDVERGAVVVTAGDRDVSDAFVPAGPGLRGLVTDLAPGASTIRATAPNGPSAALEVVNTSTGGPVFSGPLVEPWTCGNGSPEPDCSQAPTVRYHYKSTEDDGLQAYDPQNPPDDVATTTTDEGNVVPFIVREEIGYSLRDQYRIAALFDPALGEPDPTARHPGFADKLVLTHGASCDTDYESGSAPGVLLEDALSQGFAVASHALDNAGHNCNLVTQAESLVVTKEMVVERFGPLRYTIGTGCSGGSLVVQQVANAYPGIYQGITPQCSFTDTWSTAQQYAEYLGLRRYLEDPATFPEHRITPAQWPAIFGHANPANQITFTTAIPYSGDPSRDCPGVPEEDVYDAETNPDGVRCTLTDYMRNVFGVFEDGPLAGFARRPIGNIGVQYGLSGLRTFLLSGDPADPTRPPLTPDQFVALNAGITGIDYDAKPIPTRTAADLLAQERVYRSGAANTGANMDTVAIIDLGGPEPGAFHDVYRKYSMRDRLIREHGHADNQVLWEGQTPLLGDVSFATDSIRVMDEWLAAVEADGRDIPLADKIVGAKGPAGVAERCVGATGIDVPLTVCDVTVDATIYSSPRIEAGGGDHAPVNGVGPDTVGFTDDRLACETMPIDDFVYGGRSFTDVFTPDQQASLRASFPDGVCDYSKPGIGFQAAVPWLTYQDAAGVVVYGGVPLGAPPLSTSTARPAAPAGGPTPGAVATLPPRVGLVTGGR